MYVTDITVNSTADFDLFALFNRSHRVMMPLFFASAAVGSQGNRYQNGFVRCDVAVSLPYVCMVSNNEGKF